MGIEQNLKLNEDKILEVLINAFAVGNFLANSHPQSTATFRIRRHPRGKVTHNSLASTETFIIHNGGLTFNTHWLR